MIALLSEFGTTTFSVMETVSPEMRGRLAPGAHEVKIAPCGFYSTRNGRWLAEWLRTAGGEGCYALVNRRRPGGEISLNVVTGGR